MKKAKFRDIRPLPLGISPTDRKIYIKASIETVYEETLIISAYAVVNERKPLGYVCIFQQFITETDFVGINYLDSEDGVWSESTLLRFFETNRWHLDIEDRYNAYLRCATENDNEIINKYYHTKFEVGVNLIGHHQSELRKSALYYRYDIERRRLMRIHDQEIYLPSDLYDWINDSIGKDNAKYFFKTDKNSKLKHGTCSYCKTDSTIKVAKHNEYGICPSCGTKVEFKGINMAKYYREHDHFAFIQRIDSGLMVRRFKVRLDYKHPDRAFNPKAVEISLMELSRSVLEESKNIPSHYEYGEFTKGEYRWMKEIYHSSYYGNNSVGATTRNTFMRIYPFNLKDVITGTKWEYCAIEKFRGKIDPVDYFEFSDSKLLEMIVRRGFNKLAETMINSNYSERSATIKIEHSKMMGLSEYNYFMSKKHDLGIKEIGIIKVLETAFNTKPSLEQISWVSSCHDRFARIATILEHTSLQKLINYANKKALEEKGSVRDIIVEWDDYIQAAKELKYNLGNDMLLYPRDLKKSHDDAMKALKLKKDKDTNSGVVKIAKKFSWLNFSRSGLEIKVAKDTKEIIKESEVLGHCVGRGGGYISSMAEGKTLILTIRKKTAPSTPYFTVEADPITFAVRQYESKNRLRKSDEIEKFITSWKKHIAKMSVQSKKLTKVRRDDYEHRIAN